MPCHALSEVSGGWNPHRRIHFCIRVDLGYRFQAEFVQTLESLDLVMRSCGILWRCDVIISELRIAASICSVRKFVVHATSYHYHSLAACRCYSFIVEKTGWSTDAAVDETWGNILIGNLDLHIGHWSFGARKASAEFSLGMPNTKAHLEGPLEGPLVLVLRFKTVWAQVSVVHLRAAGARGVRTIDCHIYIPTRT